MRIKKGAFIAVSHPYHHVHLYVEHSDEDIDNAKLLRLIIIYHSLYMVVLDGFRGVCVYLTKRRPS